MLFLLLSLFKGMELNVNLQDFDLKNMWALSVECMSI